MKNEANYWASYKKLIERKRKQIKQAQADLNKLLVQCQHEETVREFQSDIDTYGRCIGGSDWDRCVVCRDKLNVKEHNW